MSAEPVAWRYRYGNSKWRLADEPAYGWAEDHPGFEQEPLYTAPPKESESSVAQQMPDSASVRADRSAHTQCESATTSVAATDSPTPLTNGNCGRVTNAMGEHLQAVTASFARTLERKLAEAERELAKWKDQGQAWFNERAYQTDRADQAEARLRAMRGALETVRSLLYACRAQRAESDDKIIAGHIDAAHDIADEALKDSSHDR